MKRLLITQLQQFADFESLQFEGKEGITEAFASVTSALKAQGYDVLINETAKNEYIPYSRFSEVVTEKNNLSSSLISANLELEKLKKSAPDEKTQTQIQNLINQNNELSEKLKEATIRREVQRLANDAIDADDVFGALNLDVVALDDKGNVTGVDTEIARIKAAKPHWFKQVTNKGGTDNSTIQNPSGSSMNNFIRAMAGR